MPNISRKPGAAGEGGMDEDTKKILEDMEAEGIDTSSIVPEGERVEKPEAAAEEDEETQEGESDPEPEEDDEEEDPTEEEDEESEEEEEENAEDEDETGDDTGKKKLTIVQKYRREKKLRKEAEQALTALQTSRSDEDFDKQLTSFAEEAGMNIDIARKFLTLAAQRAGLPQELLTELKRSQSERRNMEHWQHQHAAFDRDFRSNVAPMLKTMGKTDDEIQQVYATLNEDDTSPFWAWNKKNKPASLVQLALNLTKTSSRRISSEGSGTRSFNRGGKQSKDPAEMTGEDINEMSDEEFDSFSDSLGKQSKSVVHRS